MKVNWLTIGCMTMLLSFAGTAMRAQDRDHDQDQHGHGEQDQNHHEQATRGQDHQDQGRQDHSKFDDHDRQVSRDWYNQHRGHEPSGFSDRLTSRDEARLQPGFVLDHDMRGRMHTLPADYSRRLSPAPRGYRYVSIGGHVCLIDNSYRVQDVIHLELNF